MSETLELPERLSRREFLRTGALGLLAMGIPAGWARPRLELEEPLLGRVADWTARVRVEPDYASEVVRTVLRDEVLTLDAAVIGGREPEHNRVWYHIPGQGYVHSSPVQPVRDDPQVPLLEIPERGKLFEVSVPFTDVRWEPATAASRAYRFYYQSTHWIIGLTYDARGRTWYQVLDDKTGHGYWGRAEDFRPISAAELTQISPDVPADEKRILVDLSRQWMICSEGSEDVLMAKISSGAMLENGLSLTPGGQFLTYYKRHSRHMAAGGEGYGYDLPGVPWVAYITDTGISFHGTYWHNDFGAPRSHGCINMASPTAKWLFRWTTPAVPATQQHVRGSVGTRARITW